MFRVGERIAHFVEQRDQAKTRIGIPTPALAEVLVRSGAAAVKVVEKIKEFAVFEILPFHELGLIELAIMTRNAMDAGDKRAGSTEAWQKVKFDRQFLAIARVRQATALYPDDAGLRGLATSLSTSAATPAKPENPRWNLGPGTLLSASNQALSADLGQLRS